MNSNLSTIYFSDLKPDNIALTPEGHVRLLDFGNSRYVDGLEYLPSSSITFTAPEIHDGQKSDLSFDIYSYGMTLAFMFHPKSLGQIQRFGNWWLRTGNKEADKLINQCLKYGRKRRPRTLTNHPYFENVSIIPSFKPGVITTEYKKPECWLLKYFFNTKCWPVTLEDAPLLSYCALRLPSSQLLKEFQLPNLFELDDKDDSN